MAGSMPRLFILGAGGHGAVVADIALRAGLNPSGFVDAFKAGGRLLDLPIHASLEGLDAEALVLALGDNYKRQQLLESLRDQGSFLFPTLIHPSAVVAGSVTIGPGSMIMAGAIIGPNTRVGEFCIVNHRASLDHDSRLADFASLAPGAITGGGVKIGQRSAVSLAAAVKHGVKIGKDTVLGANSYLNKDLGDELIAYGSPAKQIRSRSPGEPYL